MQPDQVVAAPAACRACPTPEPGRVQPASAHRLGALEAPPLANGSLIGRALAGGRSKDQYCRLIRSSASQAAFCFGVGVSGGWLACDFMPSSAGLSYSALRSDTAETIDSAASSARATAAARPGPPPSSRPNNWARLPIAVGNAWPLASWRCWLQPTRAKITKPSRAAVFC